MRELKKVTVNVANVELYCWERYICNTANHVCPSPSDFMYNAWRDSAGTACYIVDTNRAMRGKGIMDVAEWYFDRVLNSDTLCMKTKAAYGHFLMNGRVYCVYYKRDDNGVWWADSLPTGETTGC